MTKRGQNPYSSNASSGFSNVPSPTSYDQRPAANYSQVEADRQQAPSSRVGGGGFKTKGMQLGSKKVGKDQDVLNAALGGLTVDDDGGRYSQPAEREPVVEVVQARAPVGLEKEENPFGHVEVAECVSCTPLNHLTPFQRSPHSPRIAFAHSPTRWWPHLSFAQGRPRLDPRLAGAVQLGPHSASPRDVHQHARRQGQRDPIQDASERGQGGLGGAGRDQAQGGEEGIPRRPSAGRAQVARHWQGRGRRPHLQCVPLCPTRATLTQSVNCWPTISQNLVTINLEYELESGHSALKSLSNLTITIPLPSSSAEPQVSEEPSTGHTEWNRATNEFVWSVGDVGGEQEGSGTLEFTVEGEDMEDFFPVKVDFISQVGICGVQVRLLPPLCWG